MEREMPFLNGRTSLPLSRMVAGTSTVRGSPGTNDSEVLCVDGIPKGLFSSSLSFPQAVPPQHSISFGHSSDDLDGHGKEQVLLASS
mmetsp:Transcript_20000/g.32858  ORF Transcript_20000/g.32858 Transcript_20000/m.32858 type:complete len:87 (+) Transcript_20000:4249-4509(+)